MNKIHSAAERFLVEVLARMIVARGLTVCVDSDGLDAGGQVEYDLEKSSDPRTIVEAVYAVEHCRLLLRPSDSGLVQGVIVLVLGNSPEEVVSDYSTTSPTTDIVAAWNAVADTVESLLSDIGAAPRGCSGEPQQVQEWQKAGGLRGR